MIHRFLLALLLTVPFAPLVLADGPADNSVEKARPVPPPGSKLPEAVRSELQSGLKELQGLIKEIGQHELLPDVQIYEKAVRWALDYDEVYDGKGAAPGGAVKNVLKTGLERAKALKTGKTPWTTATGLVVRGYKSKIDGSVQPYGLVIPADYDPQGTAKHRLDFWWHGRGENLSEANFIDGRQKSAGEFTPKGALVLHPYGRYCNANKFAGEIDTLECLAHARKHYRIDDRRIVARGFSMGGAACWQFTVHFPGLFCASAPGAGFADTKEFLHFFQKETVQPQWWEEKLWRMYDATSSAQNIFNIPTVAYSGEKDSQKQAADIMAREMKKVGLDLNHIIGPGAGHNYEKNAKAEINKQIDKLVEAGLPEPGKRQEIKFVTYTLRYDHCSWIKVTGLKKHWEAGEIQAKQVDGNYDVKTKGITGLEITLWHENPSITLDGTVLREARGTANKLMDKPTTFHAVLVNGKWREGQAEAGLHKIHGLQGPIDDAFLGAFLMVKPTGKPMNAAIGDWTAKEMAHAQDHWRKQFRGDAPIKSDSEITEEDIKNNNLILWGDPQSNAVLAKIAKQLPLVEFTDKLVTTCIYPNPLNPKKYIVLNSGFTFREYDYLNNARQVSKLPDYAIIDISTPPSVRFPGKIVRAGFFGEFWEMLKDDGRGSK